MTSHQLPGSGLVPAATKLSAASTPHAGAKCSLTWRCSAAAAACTSAAATSLLSLMTETRIVATFPPQCAPRRTPRRASQFRSRVSIPGVGFPGDVAQRDRRALANLGDEIVGHDRRE